MEVLKMKIIGTSGYTPFGSKIAKLFTSCRLYFDGRSLQIDIGNKYSGTRVDNLLITHTHYDHVQHVKTLPEGIPVLIPSLTFRETLQKKQPKAEYRVFKTTISLDGLSVKPFPVFHSSTTLTYGLEFSWDGKRMVWLPDWFLIPEMSERFGDLDYLFIGAAAMKKPIRHKGYGHGQGAIYSMLEKINGLSKPPKQIYLIHFGMGMRPIILKTKYLQKDFPNLKIAYTKDGMKLDL